MYEVIIIGAGVSGCSIARELSRYNIKVCVLEKEEDVCCGTSKANSAIVHAGFDAETGSLMAKLNVIGCNLMAKLAEELDFDYIQNGSLVVCTDEADMPKLEELYKRGIKNGVDGLRIVDREELLKMEPNISDMAVAALYAPTAGIVCPFQLTIAMAENACTNGVEFLFNEEVKDIREISGGYRVVTQNAEIDTKVVVNAAGVYADKIHNLVSENKIQIIPRKGEYLLLDRQEGNHVKHTIFALPGRMGKGVLVSPTVHGNLIVGPTSEDIKNKEGTYTTCEGLEEVEKKSALTVKNIRYRQVITSFAGLRAHQTGHEFIIKEVEGHPGFIDCAGIESPGLSSSPAIGKMVADLVKEILSCDLKEGFVNKRKRIAQLSKLSMEDRNALIKSDSAYGSIICRCENVSEGEIREAIRRKPGAKSLDGIKRRTRAGMGRCQAGFCSPRVMDILKEELSMDMTDITKAGAGSEIVISKSKDNI